MCVHGGQAQPMASNPNVKVGGLPVVTQINTYGVVGCTFPVMTSGLQPPCATAQWVSAATKVLCNGAPVLLFDSQAICVPTGTPLLIAGSQILVSGT